MKFRYPSEFEHQDYVLITWPRFQFSAKEYDVYKVFCELIIAIQHEVKVIINCNIDNLEVCKKKLLDLNIDIEPFIFTTFEDDLNWARDYGPDILTTIDGDTQLIDFNFNTYGLEDPKSVENMKNKSFARKIAATLNCENVLSSEIITEGGNKEFNGTGVMLALKNTEHTKRNPNHTLTSLESVYKYLFGLNKIIWLNKGSFEDDDFFDGILHYHDDRPVYRSLSANGHIDEICRFVGVNDIMLAEVIDGKTSSDEVTQQRLNDAYETLSGETNIKGDLFNIIRMPTPVSFTIEIDTPDEIHRIWSYYKEKLNVEKLRDGSVYPSGKMLVQPAMSYCNFLICNNVVVGQKYYTDGMSDDIRKRDELAYQVLKNTFPSKKIITINAMALNILGGGIHCVTKNISL